MDIENGKITDLDYTGLVKSKSGNILGDAHELFVRAIFMRLGVPVGGVDFSASPYDIFVTAKTSNTTYKILRAQIKTIVKSLTLKAGSRGGIDREYKSSAKTYKYTEDDIDLLIGVDKFTLDLYLFPAISLSKYGGSVSKNKIVACKNNWEILQNWNLPYLHALKSEFK